MSSDIGNVDCVNAVDFYLKSSSGAIKIQLHKVTIDRGMSWDQAFNAYKKSVEQYSSDLKEFGFYVNSMVRLDLRQRFKTFVDLFLVSETYD